MRVSRTRSLRALGLVAVTTLAICAPVVAGQARALRASSSSPPTAPPSPTAATTPAGAWSTFHPDDGATFDSRPWTGYSASSPGGQLPGPSQGRAHPTPRESRQIVAPTHAPTA